MSVKVGVVSFAHIHAPPYASVLSSLDAADFVGIADDDASRGPEAAGRFGVRFFEDAQGLFEAVDAVVVCSENSNHARDTVAALENGVHVLCEKPISTTVEDPRAMIRASEEAGHQLRIAFPVRSLPAVRQAKEIVRSGRIGRVLAVNGTNHGQIPGGWFLDPELAGGGAVMDHTVHVADGAALDARYRGEECLRRDRNLLRGRGDRRRCHFDAGTRGWSHSRWRLRHHRPELVSRGGLPDLGRRNAPDHRHLRSIERGRIRPAAYDLRPRGRERLLDVHGRT
jgi:Oxidoreductase family, NAD-binding Rossmann fold